VVPFFVPLIRYPKFGTHGPELAIVARRGPLCG
jgi:hypothetical protein